MKTRKRESGVIRGPEARSIVSYAGSAPSDGAEGHDPVPFPGGGHEGDPLPVVGEGGAADGFPDVVGVVIEGLLPGDLCAQEGGGCQEEEAQGEGTAKKCLDSMVRPEGWGNR